MIFYLWVLYTLTSMVVSGILPAILVWATIKYAWLLIGLTLPLAVGIYYFTLFALMAWPSVRVWSKVDDSLKNGVFKGKNRIKYFKKSQSNPYALLYIYSHETAIRMVFLLHYLFSPVITMLMYKFMGAEIGKGSSVYGKIMDPIMTKIGSNSIIGTDAILSCHADNRTAFVAGPVRIGNNCLVGGMSIIGPGVVVEDDCVIAAGSMILSNKRVRKGTTYIRGKP